MTVATRRFWIALGTRASAELAFFGRTAGRRDEVWPVLCLDTDRAPEALLDERGRPDPERFVALSGFAPRRFAEERLEADRAALGWLSPDAFDQLPREYLHEARSITRVLGRLAYERARAAIRGRIDAAVRGAERVAAGVVLDAGGGMSGALLPLLADLWIAAEAAGARPVIDVVVALDAANAAADVERHARAFATLRELERIAALPWELRGEGGVVPRFAGTPPIRRVHLLRPFDAGAPELPLTGLLEIVQGVDGEAPPRDASGKIDRESASGRIYESTAHARELDASGRAPKVFFAHGTRELVFPMAMLERTLIARYERELVVEALAGDPRRTGRAGQALPRLIQDTARAAGFAAIESDLTAWAARKVADVLSPMLPRTVEKREVREGRIEVALEAFRAKLLAVAEELAEQAERPIEEALPAVRAALHITPHVRAGVSVPAIAEAARAAVEQARNNARSLDSGRRDALTADAFDRAWARMVRKEGPLLAVRAAADSLFSAERKITEALAPLIAEAELIAQQRLAGVIASAEARFWRRASVSDVRAPDPSPLEEHARRVARLRDCQVAAILTQLDYTAMRKQSAPMFTGKAARLFLPDARQVNEIERLAEHQEIFAPMLPRDGGGVGPAFDELAAILDVLAAEDGLTLEDEAASSDPARFVTAMKRAIRGRGVRLLGAKIEPRLSLHLGRLRPDARAERAAELVFEVPFELDRAALDETLDRPEPLAAAGAQVPEAAPLAIPGVHGIARVAWDRLVVTRAWCALPLFAIRDIEALRAAYEAALPSTPLHVEAHHLEEARANTWSLAASRLPTSKQLADEAKARIPEPEAPAVPSDAAGGDGDEAAGRDTARAAAHLAGAAASNGAAEAAHAACAANDGAPEGAAHASSPANDGAPDGAVQAAGAAGDGATEAAAAAAGAPLDAGVAASLDDATIPNAPAHGERLPVTFPHPDAIATFALARAVTRALRDDDDIARALERVLPLRLERFSERDNAGLIEMERVPGEGWHVFAIALRTINATELTPGDRVALGRYDLAANLLAYAAEPDVIRMHQRFLDTVSERLDRTGELHVLDEARRRLAVRIQEQRDARATEMNDVERTLYERLIEVLLASPTAPGPPAFVAPL